jgi:hypothetical protein
VAQATHSTNADYVISPGSNYMQTAYVSNLNAVSLVAGGTNFLSTLISSNVMWVGSGVRPYGLGSSYQFAINNPSTSDEYQGIRFGAASGSALHELRFAWGGGFSLYHIGAGGSVDGQIYSTPSSMTFSTGSGNVSPFTALTLTPTNVTIATNLFLSGNLTASGSVTATNGVIIGATGTNVISDQGSAVSGWTATNGVFTTTAGTRTFTHNTTSTSVTNTSTLTGTVWGNGAQTEYYNGSATVTIGKTNGTLTTTGVVTASGYDCATNLWTIGNFPLGTNLYYTVGANTVGISGIGNGPTTTERFGQLTIKATGDITFTNLVSIATSDFLRTRTITNGNFAVIAIDVYPGIVTNMAIAQFRTQ